MSLTLDEYQSHVLRTSNDQPPKLGLLNWALGLAGEAGEFADLIKKHVFHQHDLDETKAVKELGDALWYIARAADQLGVPLSAVAQMNVDKLKARYPNGWTREDSIARRDVEMPDFVAVGSPARPHRTGPLKAGFVMGAAHQTDPSDSWCAVHTATCPEWCESDPADGYEVG